MSQSAGASNWTLDLPDSVVVHATTVRVADLARGPVPDAAGQVVVAAGGRPGAVIEITGRAILRRLVMAGAASGVSLAGAEHCRIVFAGGALTGATLRQRVADYLRQYIPSEVPDAPPSWLELELPEVQIMVGDLWDVSWPQPRPLVAGRNLLTLRIQSGESSQRLSVAAILHAYGRVASPMRSVLRGQAADPAAVQWQWTDLAMVQPGLVTDPRAMQDRQFARDLEPGEILAQRDLAPQPLVRRGEMVDLVLRRGNVSAILRVECRQDGILDQTVSVRNPLTNSLMVARVAAPGVVTTGR